MRASFEARIARAAELAQKYPAARELLLFYRELAIFQKSIFDSPAEACATDVRHFPALLDLVRRSGPKPLADFGAEHFSSAEEQERALVECWEGRLEDPGERFYARALLQPVAEKNSEDCPFCKSRPAAAVLRGEGERWLVCSMCSSERIFRRVVCPNCGEEDKEKLPVYTAAEFEHVRAEACDSCKTYIKSVDLTRDGHAVPMVDDLATVALSIWMGERGYVKVPNLLGL